MRTVFFILIGMVIIIAGCTKERADLLSSSDLKYLALMPQDASIIGTMNFSKIHQTKIYDLFMKYAKHNPFDSEDYKVFTEETGFDLEKDLSQFYFAGIGRGHKYQTNGIFIATGKFTPEKISEFIESKADDSEKLISESYHNFKLYRVHRKDMAFCFADDQTLIGGRDSLVMIALDRFGKENSLSDNLQNEISSIRYKTHAWIWMNTEQFLASLPMSEFGDRLRSLDSITNGQMSVELADDIKFDGRCTCRDKENAELIQDMIKGGIAAAKLSFTEDRNAIDILNKIEVESDDNKVKVNFDMSGKEIDYLLSKQGFIAIAKR